MNSAFPSPVIGHGGNHNNHNNQSNCCGNCHLGSQTLPANCNGGNNSLQDWSSKNLSTHTHTQHCHHSSSGSGANGDDAELQWWTISARTMGMFALSLVFILIWTSVISGILVTHSFREHETANNAAELFALQKQIGQFAFLVGKEMVSAVNITFDIETSLIEDNHLHNNDSTFDRLMMNSKSLMNVTDRFLITIQPSFISKGLTELHEDLSETLNKFRIRCHNTLNTDRLEHLNSNSESTFNKLFVHSTECIRAYEHHFENLESFMLKDNAWLNDRHTKLIQNDLILRNQPYTLFIKGVLHRFTCLAMGMILVQSDFNASSLVSMSEYYHYFYSSRQLIESSFIWNQRFLSKYMDLDRIDYTSSELLFKMFEQRNVEERQFYDKISALFNQLIGVNGLRKIRSEIKKKNVESVERMLEIDEGSGKRSKYIADPNQILFQIKPELLLEKVDLEENIEQIIAKHDQISSVAKRRIDLSAKYNQVIVNQFEFLARVQDFLNISISAQLLQSKLSEESNFLYHSMVSAILICSVLFCLLLFCCSYCLSRNLPLSTPYRNQRMPWGRRMRRQFWALGTSPFALLCACFTSSSSTAHRTQRHTSQSVSGNNSSNRYPLLYKSSNHRSQSPSCHNGQTPNGSCNQCLPCNSSPSTFLLTSKRTWHRYLAAGFQYHSHLHSHSYHNSTTSTNQNVSHRHVSKLRNGSGVAPINGVNHNRHAETALIKLNTSATTTSSATVTAVTNSESSDRCRSNSHGCCMACRDPSCTGFYDPGESAKYSAPVQNDKCICTNCTQADVCVIEDDIGSMPPSSTRLEKRNISERERTMVNKDNNNREITIGPTTQKSLTHHASRESTLSVDFVSNIESKASLSTKIDNKRSKWATEKSEN